MITFAVGLSLLLTAPGSPDSMVRVVVRDVSVGLPPGHFWGKPKTTFRVGTCCVRVEEKKNPETGIHLLLIINEPDVWMVNQVNLVADHMVDPGPTFNAHAPILPEPGLEDLEFGHEVAYMKGRGASREGPVTCPSGKCFRYALLNAGYQITLFTIAAGDRPTEIRIKTPSGREQILAYDSYEAALPVKPELFRPPEGVKLRERK